MKKSTRRLGILLYAISCLALTLLAAELFTRQVLLPRAFLYFHPTPGQFPRYRLASTYQAEGVTIRDSRRQYHSRPPREHNIAFIGDSVTFGRTADPDIFVERIQSGQHRFNAYNYGVPGYGLMEIHAVLKEALQEREYAGVVYLFNTNDPAPAMSGKLSLLLRPEDRLVSVDNYEGLKGKIQQLIKDHWKTAALLLIAQESARHPEGTRTHRQASEEPMRLSDIAAWAQQGSFTQEHWAKGKIYADAPLMEKISAKLTQMKELAQSRGAFFLVAFHYDYWTMKDENEAFRDILLEVCREAGVETLDTFELYRAHFREDAFYSDPRHLGKRGDAVLGEFLMEALLERLQPEGSEGIHPLGKGAEILSHRHRRRAVIGGKQPGRLERSARLGAAEG